MELTNTCKLKKMVKMKKINLMMTSLAALLIAGCSQNEVTDVSPDAHPQVGFSVYTGNSTRGVDMTTASMKDDPTEADKYGGFGIYAYFTGQKTFEEAKADATPSYMHNQMVKWDATLNNGNGGWTYTPIKYWPNRPDDKISFFAYAPYESNWQTGTKAGIVSSAATEKGIPYLSFTLKDKDNLKKMVDLVVADQRDQSYTSVNGGKVSFTFEHTLSRISFQAQLGDGEFDGMDGTNSFVYITHMWIVGTDHTDAGSNLSLIDQAAAVNTASKFYTKAKWSELHWNYGTSDITIPKADFSLDNILNLETTGIIESNPTDGHAGNVKGIKITKDSQTTPVSLFPDKQYLYLIPVGDNDADLSKNSGCAKGDIKIGFHYDIVTEDKSHSGQFIASHAESVIELPAGHMKRKESYLYTLKINLHEIKIDKAEVTEWSDTKKEVDIQ